MRCEQAKVLDFRGIELIRLTIELLCVIDALCKMQQSRSANCVAMMLANLNGS
jgi:hypothetical protein